MNTKLWLIGGLLVLAVAVMVGPVSAATSGTSNVTGNPAATIDITVTGNITNWALAIGANNDASTVALTVSANNPGWTVQVKDTMDHSKPAGTEGKMSEYNTATDLFVTSSPKTLTNAMHVQGGSGTGYAGSDVTLTQNDQAMVTGSAAVSTQAVTTTISQNVAYTDQRLSGTVYRMFVTFTGYAT